MGWVLGAGVWGVAEEDKENILKTNLSYSTDGLRVLGFAYQEIVKEEIYNITEDNMTFLGMISMMDPPREESKAAVEECKMAGIRPIMITGDHKITAAAIAKQIGILGDKDKAVEGAEIDGLSDQDLIDYVENVSVYARVSPEHKIRIVKAWQDKGNIVAMTGDGVNDAPALKQADIGVAMGITGTEVAKDAASMVLTDDNFATIVKAVENGRNVYQNIKKSIQFLLSGNTAGIIAVIYASIAGLAVPFAPVHLLFINLLTDSLPAIALGLDPHSLGVMKEKPRDKDESILTKDFLMGILVEGFVIAIMTMSAYYVGLENSGEAAASTMAFATLCLSRLVHGFNSKSQKAIIFTKEIVNNKYLFGAFFVGFI
ncbi:ATPase, partial [Lachnotalea glycerini]